MKIECTLNNTELIEVAKRWVKELAESGGRKWSLQVPVNFNRDPDMIFLELCKRLESSLLPVHKEPIKLLDLPVGSLFKYKNCIALKSEYRTEKGAAESYIVGSGEMFWGGTNTAEDLNELIVTPLEIN